MTFITQRTTVAITSIRSIYLHVSSFLNNWESWTQEVEPKTKVKQITQKSSHAVFSFPSKAF